MCTPTVLHFPCLHTCSLFLTEFAQTSGWGGGPGRGTVFNIRPTDPTLRPRPIPTRVGPTDRPSAARSAAKCLGRRRPTDRPASDPDPDRHVGRGRPTDRPSLASLVCAGTHNLPRAFRKRNDRRGVRGLRTWTSLMAANYWSPRALRQWGWAVLLAPTFLGCADATADRHCPRGTGGARLDPGEREGSRGRS